MKVKGSTMEEKEKVKQNLIKNIRDMLETYSSINTLSDINIKKVCKEANVVYANFSNVLYKGNLKRIGVDALERVQYVLKRHLSLYEVERKEHLIIHSFIDYISAVESNSNDVDKKKKLLTFYIRKFNNQLRDEFIKLFETMIETTEAGDRLNE
jgi:hypothetical protein